MSDIAVAEPDGSEPLAICLSNRSWLIDYYKIDAMIALRYYSDEPPASRKDVEAESKAVNHIKTCPRCRLWIHHAIPDTVMKRQHRLSQYCCAGMFVACEEPDRKNKIEFELFRGEDPCWKIDGKRSFISFCPWCGKKLPAKPFIGE